MCSFTEIASDITICSCTPVSIFIRPLYGGMYHIDAPKRYHLKKSVTFRKIKDIDAAQFANDVKEHPLLNIEDQIDEIDILVTNLETALRDPLDSHALERSRVITCRPK